MGEGRGEGDAGAAAISEASTTTVRTVISGRGTAPSLDSTTNLIDDFAGIDLDETAQAEIYRVLQECAARRRAVEGTPDDPDELFISVEQPEKEVLVYDPGFKHPRKVMKRPTPPTDVVVEAEEFLEPSPRMLVDDPFRSSDEELPWHILDDEKQCTEIEEAVASVKRVKSA
jgi:hypothetical protein